MRTIALMLSLAALPVLAQTQSKGNPPNLNGAWAVYRAGRGAAADPKLAAPAAGPMLLKSPYADAYKKRQAAEREADQRGEPLGNRGTLCIPYGMPQMMSAIYPLEILQTPGQITIITEAFSEVRRIYLGKAQLAPEDVDPGYYGRSAGHWEGDTLIVDTIGIKETVRGYQGMPHSAKMRVSERIRRTGPQALQDQITIDDPVVLEKPVVYTLAYKLTPNYEMVEFVCDNNREYIDEKGVVRLKLRDK